ncbi:MAG TPA: hypothetical protein VN026_03120 [Bacteroidia bacterium]|jgi:hypothetical protein|nr:hypothetical protein [Bacteroidia bacterium]
MRYTLRFYLSWILGALAMYVAFYVWHGVVLNDFKQIQFPIVWFVILSAFAYLVISYVLYRVFETKILSYFDSTIFRGFLTALIVGVSLFAIMTVLHISFTKNVTSTYLITDFFWQIIEQSVGALFIVLGKQFIFEPEFEPEEI